MLCSVKGNPVHRRGARRRGPPGDPVAALRDYTIKLLDKGDGRGIDWSKAAETAFRVAFSCLDEAKGDERAMNVIRRVQDLAYTRMVGTADSGLPYTSDRPEAPPFMPDAELSPDFELNP